MNNVHIGRANYAESLVEGEKEKESVGVMVEYISVLSGLMYPAHREDVELEIKKLAENFAQYIESLTQDVASTFIQLFYAALENKIGGAYLSPDKSVMAWASAEVAKRRGLAAKSSKGSGSVSVVSTSPGSNAVISIEGPTENS